MSYLAPAGHHTQYSACQVYIMNCPAQAQSSVAPTITHHHLHLADRTHHIIIYSKSPSHICIQSAVSPGQHGPSTNLKHRLSIVVHRQDVGDSILRQTLFVFCICNKTKQNISHVCTLAFAPEQPYGQLLPSHVRPYYLVLKAGVHRLRSLALILAIMLVPSCGAPNSSSSSS